MAANHIERWCVTCDAKESLPSAIEELWGPVGLPWEAAPQGWLPGDVALISRPVDGWN